MTWKNGEYPAHQLRAVHKKNRILEAALTLFSRRGFHKTTAKAIAAAAGVATGSFYRYFKDKKAAFMAVCLRQEQQIGDRIFEMGRQMRNQGQSEQEILTALIRFAVFSHEKNKAFHREVLAMQIQDPDVGAWVKDREERMRRAFLDFLTPVSDQFRVADLQAAGELIYYAIEEIAHRAVIFESVSGRDRLVAELCDMLSRYLLKDP